MLLMFLKVLKWLAFQEYLLYLCRGGLANFGIEIWLDILCKRTERALPRIHSDLSIRSPISGEVYGHRVEEVITDPDIITCDKRILQYLTGRDNKNPLIGQKIVAHLRELEHNEVILERALKVFGIRLKKRRDDFAAYLERINSISIRQDQELDDIMSFFKFAQAGERNDMEMWRRLDMERQSIRITIGRLQKLLGTERKMNHNRNKNKNRAAKKKTEKLQQNKEMVSQGGSDKESETG